MDFSLKRWGAHFCPPPIWAAKKACFFASVPSSWACCPHVFSFSFTSILCFSSWFLHIFSFICQIFCVRKRKVADFGSNLLCFPMIIPCKFRIIFRPVRLKLSSTPSCTIEITQYPLLYYWNYPTHPPVRLILSCTPFCLVEIIQHTLLYGWNYPVHPSVWLKLSCTPFCMV